jgi:aminopeptidase YwaD
MDCADYDYNVGGTETLNPTTLTIGSTYYIKVQDYSSTLPTTFSFTVAVQSTAVATDVEASTSVQQINLFPNPAQNILNVENIQMQTTIELVDLTGRVLFSREISSDSHIDLSEFAEGVYILKLSVNGVVENRRVVLSR